MNGTTFDTLTAAKALREAGFEARQAEAVAGVMRHAVGADRDALATKADLDARFAKVDARFAEMRADIDARFAGVDARFAAARADMYRALWVQGAGLVAVMAALNAALIAVFEFFR